MSDTESPTAPTPDTPTETPAEQAAKKTRELRDFPTRIFEKIKGGWKLLPEVFGTLTEGEAWRDAHGTPGRVYWVLKGAELPEEVVGKHTRPVQP
jgi:hypothetical protein